MHNFGTITLGRHFDTDSKARSVGVAGTPSLDGVNAAATVVTSTADAGSTSVSFTGSGVALALDAVSDDGTGAVADAFGLYGGLGNDTLFNDDQVSATADAVLSATARATGMEGGDGNDWLFNAGVITLGPSLGGPAMVDGDASGANWTLGGYAQTRATATVTADGKDLAGGEGDDELRNAGTITVTGFANLVADNGAKAIGSPS